MGKHQPQSPLFHYTVQLDTRVRADHPPRAVAAAVDFSFVRPLVQSCYGRNGHVGQDPEVRLKLMFLLFFEDIPSERELLARLPERLDYLWVLGYGLDDAIPHHRVLSKARQRWGGAVFEELFARTVAQCVEAGLVDGRKIHMDATLVDANTATDSVVRGAPALIAALKALYQEPQAKWDPLPELPPLPPSAEPADLAATPLQLVPAVAAVPVGAKSLKKEVAPQEVAPQEVAPAALLCRTDPEAEVVRRPGQGSRPRYKQHRVVDDGCGVITAVVTTTGTVPENHCLALLTQQHETQTGVRVRCIVADSQYGTVENYLWCEAQGIRGHMANVKGQQCTASQRAGFLPETMFHYDAASDTFTCPGQPVPRRFHRRLERQGWQYTAGAKVCGGCALRALCTQAEGGRAILRLEQHELVSALRAQAGSSAARRDRGRRKHLMQGSFADGANNHGLKRARWRSLWRQGIQDRVIAAVQNIRWLCRKGWRGPRRALGAAAAPSGRPLGCYGGPGASAGGPMGRLGRHSGRVWQVLRPHTSVPA